MAAQWFYRCEDVVYGPIPPDVLKQLAQAGVITPDTRVKRADFDKWVRAGRVVGLFAEARMAAPQPPPLAVNHDSHRESPVQAIVLPENPATQPEGQCGVPQKTHITERGRWEPFVFGLLRFFRAVCGLVFGLQCIHVVAAAAWLSQVMDPDKWISKPEAVDVDMDLFFVLFFFKVVILAVSGLVFFGLRRVINRLHIRKHGVPHPALAETEWAL